MTRAAPPIQDIAMFVAVAENSSFTRAAEQMATSKSNVGKAVQRLEARLGTQLLQRTTRAVRLTEDGQIYLDAARMALDGLGEAEIALAARRDEPVGRVRIDLAVGLGVPLIPSFAALRARYPKVTLDLSLNDRQTDPVKEGWDIVLRIGELPASGDMIVRKLCDLRNGLYASAAYLARRGPIPDIQTLREQEGIIFRANSGQLRPWSVMEEGRPIEISPNAIVVASDGRAMIDSIKAGLGVAQIFDRVAAPFVASGELIHILPELDVPAPPVHALIPLGRRMPPKTRVVLEHVSEVLRSAS
jgi:DNA-binding transcriptional LysR family regulator